MSFFGVKNGSFWLEATAGKSIFDSTKEGPGATKVIGKA